jgi:hypothetical protein
MVRRGGIAPRAKRMPCIGLIAFPGGDLACTHIEVLAEEGFGNRGEPGRFEKEENAEI